MKAVIILLALISVCLASYPTTYDHIKLEPILRNRRLLKRYVDCLLGVPKTCNKEGQLLKDLLPDALQTKCKECNAIQKEKAMKVANYLIECKSEWWNKVEKIYDPKGIYKKQYREELLTMGVDIDANKKTTQCYN